MRRWLNPADANEAHAVPSPARLARIALVAARILGIPDASAVLGLPAAGRRVALIRSLVLCVPDARLAGLLEAAGHPGHALIGAAVVAVPHAALTVLFVASLRLRDCVSAASIAGDRGRAGGPGGGGPGDRRGSGAARQQQRGED